MREEIGSKANTKWCRGSKRKKALTVCIAIGILLFLIGFFMPKDEVTAALSLYTLEDDGENYRLSIKNTKGEEIYFEENSSSLWPNVRVIYDDTILVKKGRGDAHLYTFINVGDSLVSEDFWDIEAWNHEKVAYVTFKDDKMKLIVQDIYDKGKYYTEIEKDFVEVAVGHQIVTRAMFLNDSQLFIEYYSNGGNEGEWEEKQEVIYLLSYQD